MDCNTPSIPVHHQLPELVQTHVHRTGDAIQTSHPLSSPSPAAFNLSQHQGLFQWVSSSHQVAKVLELQLRLQPFQWIFTTDFLFFYFLTLQYCIGFAIYQHESATGIHVIPILNPPPSSLLPPSTIPLGHPSAPAPSIQYRALNLDWRLISYMILHIFQCHSPKSSHPLPLPQSPKDCSIYLCLFCCLVYRVILPSF